MITALIACIDVLFMVYVECKWPTYNFVVVPMWDNKEWFDAEMAWEWIMLPMLSRKIVYNNR